MADIIETGLTVCSICGLEVSRRSRHMRRAHAKAGYDRAARGLRKDGKVNRPKSVKAVQGGLPETSRTRH